MGMVGDRLPPRGQDLFHLDPSVPCAMPVVKRLIIIPAKRLYPSQQSSIWEERRLFQKTSAGSSFTWAPLAFRPLPSWQLLQSGRGPSRRRCVARQGPPTSGIPGSWQPGKAEGFAATCFRRSA